MRLIQLTWIVACLLFSSSLMAQTGGDFFQQIGKIYVVVGVIVVVFIGLVLYLLRLERKIKALEDYTKH